MRLMMLAFLLVFSSIAVGQMPAGMQEAIDCMESLDKEALEALGTEGEQLSKDINALCEKGDESGARELAMDYIEGMADNAVLEQLKHCSEMMQKAMPGMPIPEMPSAEMFEAESENICDDID